MADLKARLRELDRLVAPDVWSRATARESSVTSGFDPGASRTPSRLLAAVVAMAVFVASGAFAWRAFREQPQTTTPATSSAAASILWPEHTDEQLVAAQAAADASDPDAAWRLDPQQVAAQFADQVLGWGTPGGSYEISRAQTDADEVPGRTILALERLPIPCPSPPPDESLSDCPPPFQGEQLVLRQMATVGDGGVWSVSEVRASDMRIDVRAGDVVQAGGTIDVHIEATPTTTYALASLSMGEAYGWDEDCAGASWGGAYAGDLKPVVAPTEGGPNGGWSAQCLGTDVAGHAWVVSRSPDSDPEPLREDPIAHPTSSVFGLTAVPYLLAFPDTQASDSSSSTQTAKPSSTNVSPTNRLESSAILSGGKLRCTATFARDTVVPGRKIDVAFQVANFSESDVDTMVGPGHLVLSRDGQTLVDTGTVMDGSMAPIVPLNKTLPPGGSARLYDWNVPVVWAGPLDVTPYCGDEPLPVVTIQVSPPDGQPEPSSAVEQSVADTDGAFDSCLPAINAEWIVGTVVTQGDLAVGSVPARCAASVEEQPGFDVVVLAIETPPDGPPVDVASLADDVQAQPDELVDIEAAPYAISWFTYVVTSDGITRVNQRAVAVCGDVSGSGPGIAGCSSQDSPSP